jgi:hypothetical protein
MADDASLINNLVVLCLDFTTEKQTEYKHIFKFRGKYPHSSFACFYDWIKIKSAWAV